jgi:predicted nucleotidyltransferase
VHRDLPTDVVNTLRAWAAAQPEILRLYIFGSRVRGIGKNGAPPRPDSDLDIAIELSSDVPNAAFHWLENAGEWRADLSTLIPYPIDLDLLERNAPGIRTYVEVDGSLIFDRSTEKSVQPRSIYGRTS